MKKATETTPVSNTELFELHNAAALNISSELCKFLQDTKFPWQALGKNLTQFITNLIIQVDAKKRIRGKVSKNVYFENKKQVVICPGAIIEPGVYIAGPTYIGPNAVVRHGAYIRGSVYVGEGAIIGHTTECKGSILLPHAKAAHFNYVGDSILGHDSNLGAGTKLANLKISHKNILVYINNHKIDTGLKKFGAILGNRAQTGCNAVTNPGTIMLPETILMPNNTATGIVV